MNVRLNTTPVCLAKNQAVTLLRAEGALIRCLRGALWITQNRDQRDIVLEPGESFQLDRKGPAMVWALSDSAVDLRAAKPPRLDVATVRRWVQRARAALSSWPQHVLGTPGRVQ